MTLWVRYYYVTLEIIRAPFFSASGRRVIFLYIRSHNTHCKYDRIGLIFFIIIKVQTLRLLFVTVLWSIIMRFEGLNIFNDSLNTGKQL